MRRRTEKGQGLGSFDQYGLGQPSARRHWPSTGTSAGCAGVDGTVKHMEETQLNAFRQLLTSLRKELEELNSAGREAAGTVALDQSKVGRLSRMDAMQAQQMAQETVRRRQVQLQKIDSALSRIEAGEYGYCVICDEEINIARLKIEPTSTRCMGCMEE